MLIQETEQRTELPQDDPVYERTMRAARLQRRRRDRICLEKEETAAFLADCRFLPEKLREQVGLAYADALDSAEADWQRARGKLLQMGYDVYD